MKKINFVFEMQSIRTIRTQIFFSYFINNLIYKFIVNLLQINDSIVLHNTNFYKFNVSKVTLENNIHHYECK